MMKKLAFVALLAISSVAFAQDEVKPALKEKAAQAYNQGWDKLSTSLKLTPEQETQWKALNQSYAPQYKSIAGNSSLSKEDKEVQMAALHTKQEEDLKTVLTPAQNAQWNGIKKVAKTKMTAKAQDFKAARASHVPVARKRP